MEFSDRLMVWIAWMRANRPQLLRYGRGLQIVTGLVLLLLGWHMGHDHLQLLRSGTRTQGKIIGSKQERFYRDATAIGSRADMPVVEFQAGDRMVQFEDWLGSSTPPTLNQVVPVLYDASNPAVAMID